MLAVWTVICVITITAGVSIGSVHIPVAQVWRVIADHLTGVEAIAKLIHPDAFAS